MKEIKKHLKFWLLTSVSLMIFLSGFAQPQYVSLNGKWLMGVNRIYNQEVNVPGVAADPAKKQDGRLWYSREITLPKGNWSAATLELKGARFMPEVYVNGKLVSKQNGGMATTWHSLGNVKPGEKIKLEISLTSLADVPQTDASYIPPADQWRSNNASCLWDDVILHLHGKDRIGRVIPEYDINRKTAKIRFAVITADGKNNSKGTYSIEIADKNGKVLLSQTGNYGKKEGSAIFNYGHVLREWSPEEPNLYQMKIQLLDGKNILDSKEINIGIKNFEIRGKQFYLNGKPRKLAGGSIVWHRWVRSDEGRVYGYDAEWFTENIIKRLKEHGADYIRFHLGVPPERLLDLCDKYGLLVQYEWSFFHGMPASTESLMEQYPEWFDRAMQHPSIAIYHPYNETEGDQLKIVWAALDKIVRNYPPLVMSERDVIHVHKYWWSLFENVGIYYDDADQFDKAIMVDEFGGNYLDEKGDLGGYTALKESYLRFLGRTNTAEERLAFQAQASGKIAEYWRRINAAGVAPFTIASSWEDGNTWFMGPLKEGNPKPVWNALTCAFAPRSVSMDIWDRNFLPSAQIQIPLYLFNDTEKGDSLKVRLSVMDKFDKTYYQVQETNYVASFSKKVIEEQVILPSKEGNWILKAELLNDYSEVKYPVVSKWDIRTMRSQIPSSLKNVAVALAENENELAQLLQEKGIQVKPLDDAGTKLFILSKDNWSKISKGDTQLKKQINDAIEKGISVLILNAGEQYLGQGYPEKGSDLGPLQGVVKITDPRISRYEIMNGVEIAFTEAAEPESHLHADKNNSSLWWNLEREATWLWNGMRGGLLVPAADMTINGLSQSAYLEQWKARGADVEAIKNGAYYAYELQGYYDFSAKANDTDVQRKLRQKVTFIVEDAPALAGAINPLSPVNTTNLNEEYKNAINGKATKITILANAGKNLTKSPVILIEFGENRGKMIISQLLTNGRLVKSYGETTPYGVRQDEAAVQMVLNMMAELILSSSAHARFEYVVGRGNNWLSSRNEQEIKKNIDVMAENGINTVVVPATFIQLVDFADSDYPEAAQISSEVVKRNVETLRKYIQYARTKGIKYVMLNTMSHYAPTNFWKAHQEELNPDGMFNHLLSVAHQFADYNDAMAGHGVRVGHQQWDSPFYKNFFVYTTKKMLDAVPETDGFLNGYAEVAWTYDKKKLKEDKWENRKQWMPC